MCYFVLRCSEGASWGRVIRSGKRFICLIVLHTVQEALCQHLLLVGTSGRFQPRWKVKGVLYGKRRSKTGKRPCQTPGNIQLLHELLKNQNSLISGWHQAIRDGSVLVTKNTSLQAAYQISTWDLAKYPSYIK